MRGLRGVTIVLDDAVQFADQRFGLFVGEFEGRIPERGVVNQQSLVTHPGRARCGMIFLCFPEPASRSSPLLRLRLKTTARFLLARCLVYRSQLQTPHPSMGRPGRLPEQ
jgi:hypothetical protein